MTKKYEFQNLIFIDATILHEYCDVDVARSGIFFASYNIIKSLLKNEKLELLLYVDVLVYRPVKKVIYSMCDELAIPPDKRPKIITNKNELRGRLLCHFTHQIQKKHAAGKHGTAFLYLLGHLIIRCAKPITVVYNYLHSSNELRKYNLKAALCLNRSLPEFIYKRHDIKCFTLIHDMIPFLHPEYFPDKAKVAWTSELLNKIRPGDVCFTVSKQTKEDFLQQCNTIKPSDVIVTSLAADKMFHPCQSQETIMEIRRKYKIPERKKYFFSLCSLEPRKNLLFILKNFIVFINQNQINDLVLVLGGKPWKDYEETFESALNELAPVTDTILRIGYVSDKDLSVLYSGAFGFIYASLYEGFGLPVLEAMQCGCPVITSNVSSLPEVSGNAAIMIDPQNDDAARQAFTSLYFNENLRQEMIVKGIERAKNFSWDKCTNIMIEKIMTNILNADTQP